MTLTAMRMATKTGGEARQHPELLRDPGIARPRRDRDPDPDRPDRQQGRERDLRHEVRALDQRARHRRLGERRHQHEEEREHAVRDRHRWHEGCQRLAEQELIAPDRRRQRRLERPLLPLADDRVGGDDHRHEGRDAEHVDEDVFMAERSGRRSGQAEDGDQRLEDEHDREDGHPADERAVAPVLPELLSDDGADASPAHAHARSPVRSAATSSR